MKGLKHAHAGLGYLLILLAILVVGWTVVLAIRDQEQKRGSRVACTALVGLIDLQALLGLVLFVMMNKEWNWALHHPLLMIAGAVVAHVANKQESWALPGGFSVSLLLLLGGAYPVVMRSGSMLMKMVG